MKPKSNGHKPVPVAFKRGLVASYASRVHNLFKTYQPVEVSRFLGERPIFYFLLVMLAEKLRAYYPKTPLLLSIEDNDGDEQLVIQGLAAMDCSDNLIILDEIDKWWWDKVGGKVCNLTIDMFSLEEDAIPLPSPEVKRKRKKRNDFIFGRK